jgi:ethanolamine utilization microcompartment shell protein EutS
MSRGKAMGFIESLGLASAVTAADAALKAANVELIGRENSRGAGMITIKIIGDVGAVKAAIDAAKTVSSQVARVWSVDVIPRPAEALGRTLGWNADTQGASEWLGKNEPPPAPPSPNLPVIKEDAPLAARPAHEIVAVDTDIPKPVIIPDPDKEGRIEDHPEENAPEGGNSAPAADKKPDGTRPKKNPPRRRGRKPK